MLVSINHLKTKNNDLLRFLGFCREAWNLSNDMQIMTKILKNNGSSTQKDAQNMVILWMSLSYWNLFVIQK